MNVFDLFAAITLDTSKYEQQLEDAGAKTGTFGEKLKSGLATAAKIGGAALAAASAAIFKLGKDSVVGYAEYEQLVGGVETLFKASSDAVMKYADAAYQTAGLSANQYMETVTSFSASLLQSLGGDTEEAARIADQAIIDMSDNANKMGTSMESIQNAYQGFAKQNYTMLDNLKLGYGGTKEEMQRLLSDAEKISGIKYDISSFADIANAIHVVQEEMGIAGTTALEASTTIQGSLSSMKSAWSNLVTGMANENADLGKLIDNFAASVEAVASNIVPRIVTLAPRLVQGITGVIKAVTPQIPPLISTLLPALVNGATSLIVGIVDVLPDLIAMIAEQLPTMIGTIVEAIPALLPALISGVVALVVGIANALPTIIVAIVDALPMIIQSICTALIENIPILIQGAMQLVIGLVQALPEIITALIDALPSIITMVVDVIINNIPLFIEAAVTIVFAIVAALPEIFFGLIKAVVELVMSLVTTIKEKWPEFKAAAEEWFRQMLEGMKAKWEDVKAWSVRAWDDFVQWCEDVGPKLKEAGKQVLDDLWSGLKEAWAAIKAWFTGEWDSLFETSTSAGGKKIIHVNKPKAQGSHAAGLDYVPFDGYIAELHRGEMIVPAREAAALRSGKASPDVTVIQNIYSEAKTAADLMQEAMWEAERAVLMGV